MMAKARPSGFVVAYGPSENVPAALAAAFTALKAENCLVSLNTEAMTQRLAYYYSELDAIHAFREGNSRTLRAFTADLAQAAG
jgi:cell filamentation protein